MSAAVVVTSGIGKKTSFWIEDEVLRLGSAPECEVSLPVEELPRHFATLEYIDGVYFLHNRCDYDLIIGDDHLAPVDSCEWPHGTFLHVGGSCSLVLQIDGDPSPCKKPFFAREPEVVWDESVSPLERSPSESDVSQTAGGRNFKLAVILLAAVGIVATLGGGTPSSSTAAVNAEVAFEQVVADCTNPVIKAALQDAWLLTLRHRDQEADQLYRRILELLPGQTEEDSEVNRIRQYILDRRSEL